MNSRRYPRTMQSAFGPYTDSRLHPMPDERVTEHGLSYILLGLIVLLIVLAAVNFLAR